jgi:hypothetical protein
MACLNCLFPPSLCLLAIPVLLLWVTTHKVGGKVMRSKKARGVTTQSSHSFDVFYPKIYILFYTSPLGDAILIVSFAGVSYSSDRYQASG